MQPFLRSSCNTRSPETAASIWTRNISYNWEPVAPKPLVQSHFVFYRQLTCMCQTQIKMAAPDEAFHLVLSAVKIPELNSHQKQAIPKIILYEKDLFVNLLMGFGSL